MPISCLIAGAIPGQAPPTARYLRFAHSAQAVLRAEHLQRIVRACRRVGRAGSLDPQLLRGSDEVLNGAALLDQREALDGIYQIFGPRGSDESDVRRRGAREARGVHQEPATATVLEIGVQHRLTGRRHRLHHLIPAIELQDQIAADARIRIRVNDLLGLLRRRWPWRIRIEGPGRASATEPPHAS